MRKYVSWEECLVWVLGMLLIAGLWASGLEKGAEGKSPLKQIFAVQEAFGCESLVIEKIDNQEVVQQDNPPLLTLTPITHKDTVRKVKTFLRQTEDWTCEEIGLKHFWVELNLGLQLCSCTATIPPDCTCEPKTEKCLNCGLRRGFKKNCTGEWIYEEDLLIDFGRVFPLKIPTRN